MHQLLKILAIGVLAACNNARAGEPVVQPIVPLATDGGVGAAKPTIIDAGTLDGGGTASDAGGRDDAGSGSGLKPGRVGSRH